MQTRFEMAPHDRPAERVFAADQPGRKFTTARTILKKLWTAVGYRRPISNFAVYEKALRGKHGLEIGGPSSIFRRRNRIPIYPIIAGLDGCNFNQSTLWEHSRGEGQPYVYDPRKPPGRQHIRDAVDLGDLPAQTYDFVLSSHSLEHLANPLRALSEWHRVLKDAGILLLVLPDKRATFDHRRPVTSFSHLLSDFANGMREDDLTHLSEILELHDLSRDLAAGTREEFKQRSINNLNNRGMHHHVFDQELVAEMLSAAGMTVMTSEFAPPFHLITLAQKTHSFQLGAIPE